MNKNGHRATLVSSHPGNTNAVKYGVYSPRMISGRALEIAEGLEQSFDFNPVERVAVHEAAGCIALLEAIDRDIDERGIVDGRGRSRDLVALRLRVSARLERWLDKFGRVMERERSRRCAAGGAGGLRKQAPADRAP
jgi:hypothetical protein